MDTRSDAESDRKDDVVNLHFSSPESASDAEETSSGRVRVVAQVSSQTQSGHNIVRSLFHYHDFFV